MAMFDDLMRGLDEVEEFLDGKADGYKVTPRTEEQRCLPDLPGPIDNKAPSSIL